MHSVTPLTLLILISAIHAEDADATDAAQKPNILFLIADDLGIGDVGCFGNDTINTPNIDSIARQGAKLTQHLTAASTCTPSRGALLTGRYPARLGLASFHDLSMIPFVASYAGLPPEEITIAEVAKEAGYKTALIGKWHLGLNCEKFGDNCHHPLNQGFDYFYGVPLTNIKDFGDDAPPVVLSGHPDFPVHCITAIIVAFVTAMALKYCNIFGNFGVFVFVGVVTLLVGLFYYFCMNIKLWNSVLMKDFDYIEQPIRFENLTQRLVKEGTQFLEQRFLDRQPFFLVMSWIHVHTVLFTAKQFEGKSKHGRYGDNIEEMDWSVGEMLKLLEKYNMKENTLVYFTSDNGGHVEETDYEGRREGGWNGIYRGGKMQGSMDGGIRVPTTIMFPGKIPAGIKVHEPTSQMDLFPTVSHLIGQSVPSDRVIDGKEIMPLLEGRMEKSPHEFMFHYCGDELHGARYRPVDGDSTYKVIYATYNWLPGTEGCFFHCNCWEDAVWQDPPLLYDVTDDPSEKNPLDVTQNQYKTILDKVSKAVSEHKGSIDPEKAWSQFTFSKSIWRPSLQPCCNFPSCKCVDPKYANLKNF